MGIDFTAIDFETANGFRGSPCAVGLTKVRDGRVVEEASWLMRPPEGYDHFDPGNVRIHGIHPDQVAGEPRFGDLFPEIGGFIGDDLLVAHNASFDMGVIRSALEVSELPGPSFDYLCTVVLSRRNYRLMSYSLPFVAEAAGVPLVNHHDATEDARACAGILIDIARKHGATTMNELVESTGVRPTRMAEYVPGVDTLSASTRKYLDRASESRQERYTGRTPLARPWGRERPAPKPRFAWPDDAVNFEPAPDADPNHPLFGQTIVFTGELGISRTDAKERAAKVGARTASTVTRQTTVLVVGGGFVSKDLNSGRVTTKARRVMDLHAKGQKIEVLSEAEFLQMVGGAWPLGV